jgi:hypothetical protein
MSSFTDYFKNNLSDPIKDYVNNKLASMIVMQPGKILTYDPETRLASIQLLLKNSINIDNKEPVEVKPLVNVPVYHMKGLTTFFKIPIEEGVGVSVIFFDKSIDNWLSSSFGDVIDSQDTRKHNFSDAFAIPGLYSAKVLEPDTENEDIRMGDIDELAGKNSQIKIKKNGDINLELLDPNVLRLGSESATIPIALGTGTKAMIGQITNTILSDIDTWVKAANTISGGGFDPATIALYTTSVQPLLIAWAQYMNQIESVKVKAEK